MEFCIKKKTCKIKFTFLLNEIHVVHIMMVALAA